MSPSEVLIFNNVETYFLNINHIIYLLYRDNKLIVLLSYLEQHHFFFHLSVFYHVTTECIINKCHKYLFVKKIKNY